ncbi:MAG: hypothetical protein U0521_07160 [Anaerolineae bacterium]
MTQQLAQRYFPALDATMRQIVASAPRTDAEDFGTMLRYPLGWVDEHNQPYSQPDGQADLAHCCCCCPPKRLAATGRQRSPPQPPSSCCITSR